MKVETLSKFFLFITLVTGEFIPARKIEQSLNPRDNSVGGWALSAPSCPAGTTSCPIKADNAPSCCPNQYTCQYDTLGVGKHYCCPGTTNCETTIQTLPLCANTSWELYSQGYTADIEIAYFCCLPGQQGILGADIGWGDVFGSCGDGSVSYPSSIKATLKTEFTATATASGPSSPTSSEASNSPEASSIPATSGTDTAQSSSPTSAPSGEQSFQPSTGTATAATTPRGQSFQLSTSTPSTAGSTGPSSSSNASSSKLSTGAIVGIVIGVVGLMAILGIGGCMCFRYGQRRGQGRQAGPEAPLESPVFDAALTAVPATGDMKGHNPVAAAEMEYRPVRELEGYGRVEMG